MFKVQYQYGMKKEQFPGGVARRVSSWVGRPIGIHYEEMGGASFHTKISICKPAVIGKIQTWSEHEWLVCLKQNSAS